ncbi:MAG: sirohydrochlorin chelatase [Nitrospirae bacterium]|nr:sirohydrochlorin chelatase [Nitrospirota bacterium]
MIRKKWGVLLVVHGSPDNRGNLHALEAYARLKERMGDRVPMALGFIEHATPSVDESLDLLAREVEGVALVPFLLFDAGHSKSDMSAYIRRAQRLHPDLEIIRDWAFGTDQQIVTLLLEILPPVDPAIRETLVLVGRGSLDANANASLFYQGRRLWERRKGSLPLFSFISVTDPRLSDLLESLEPDRQDRLVLLPYFLFEGVLMDRIRNLGAGYREKKNFSGEIAVTPPFGDHPAFLDHVADRIARLLLTGRTPMPKWPVIYADGPVEHLTLTERES